MLKSLQTLLNCTSEVGSKNLSQAPLQVACTGNWEGEDSMSWLSMGRQDPVAETAILPGQLDGGTTVASAVAEGLPGVRQAPGVVGRFSWQHCSWLWGHETWFCPSWKFCKLR